MSLKFLKTGDAAEKALAEAEEKSKAAAANAGGSSDEFFYRYRFWMPQDAETMITFLDGDLNDNGVLTKITYEEHQKQIGGDWKNFFPCTADIEPCPLCEANVSKSFVAVFTVIDHTEWKDKNGKVHQNEKRLYVAKKQTLQRLQKLAIKRGGLRGCSFDVSRTGDQSAAVGSDFDFLKKWEDMAEFKAQYGVEDTDPLNYENVIQYKTAKELTALGLGALGASIGGEPADDVDVAADL